ncbi:PrsW family intramembrane metalloprotease [Virgibacillus sp. C22-A2]|uniref:PrsW family intramembrane metalloprotease n=1 Tax=Virgibacillus tibetensis TaxID=3042313 RepID=A0ABU6KCX2_9BACI|nr:PrsW family intramembrane metalloprotease [Virgibacillus sp. C22-A2]
MFCYNCGLQVDFEENNFCPSCGINLNRHNEGLENGSNEESSASMEQSARSITNQMRGTFLHATEKINGMVGEQGNIDLNLRDIFSAVFKKHTQEEGEILFISGTRVTTPMESEISTSWPKPWLFSRVFLALAITYILLYVCTFMFQNINALPGLIMVGSFAVPFSLLIFFWETNVPRNISIYEIAKMFFVGGTASLVTTLFLFSVFPVYELDYTGAVVVGVVEEIGKLIVVVYFIKKLNPKFILNGLLIGAAIGAGFGAFESAGYAFQFGIAYGDQVMMSVIFERAWTSIGTHVIWTAIAGAALVYVKGNNPLANDHFTDSKFIKLFAVPVILHAVWDMPLYSLHNFNFLYIMLIIVGWIFVFTFISTGLKQIGRLNVEDVNRAG